MLSKKNVKCFSNGDKMFDENTKMKAFYYSYKYNDYFISIIFKYDSNTDYFRNNPISCFYEYGKMIGDKYKLISEGKDYHIESQSILNKKQEIEFAENILCSIIDKIDLSIEYNNRKD